MSLLEIVIAIIITFITLVSVLPQFIASKQRMIAETIYSHLTTLDKALWNIDLVLQTSDTTLHIPRPSGCSVSQISNLVCAAEPFRWKNLHDYASVRDNLYDNYLDPRGRYYNIFTKFHAYADYANSGSLIHYTRICMNVGSSELANRIKALDGGSRISVSGSTVCYTLNDGAGYYMVSRSYSCTCY